MVSLVIVSHSQKIAQGVVELAKQMAEETTIIAAGGLPDGSIGTDVETIQNAIEQAMNDDGVAVLVDLGSAVMSTEIAIENCHGNAQIADGPIVEGAVVGAVNASLGMPLDKVLQSIKDTRMLPK